VPDGYGWHIGCRDLEEGMVENTVKKLLARICDFSSNLSKLRQLDPNVDVKLLVGITPYEDDIVLFFSPTTIANIASTGASFSIDFFDLT